jgi:hypothetical protein
VLAVCALAVGLAALGLLRLRVETDPQRLWVGSRSQALAEKQHFEVCASAPLLAAFVRHPLPGASLPLLAILMQLHAVLQTMRLAKRISVAMFLQQHSR